MKLYKNMHELNFNDSDQVYPATLHTFKGADFEKSYKKLIIDKILTKKIIWNVHECNNKSSKSFSLLHQMQLN